MGRFDQLAGLTENRLRKAWGAFKHSRKTGASAGQAARVGAAKFRSPGESTRELQKREMVRTAKSRGEREGGHKGKCPPGTVPRWGRCDKKDESVTSRFDELAGLTEAAPYVSFHAGKGVSGEFRGRVDKINKASGNFSLRLDRLTSAIANYNKGAGPGTPAEIKREWGYVADALDSLIAAATQAKKSALSWKKATG